MDTVDGGQAGSRAKKTQPGEGLGSDRSGLVAQVLFVFFFQELPMFFFRNDTKRKRQLLLFLPGFFQGPDARGDKAYLGET